MTDTDRSRPLQPMAPQSDGETGKVIAPDEAFQRMLKENSERAWRNYCEINGLDPDGEEAAP